MKFINRVILFFMIAVLLASCSQDHKSLIIGVWEANQISQVEGTDERLGHFNHLEVADAKINAKTFNFVSVEGGDVEKKFNKDELELHYEWSSDKEIVIEDTLLEIEIKKNEMILKNSNVEIHYTKVKE